MKKVLITGADSLIGRHLAQKLNRMRSVKLLRYEAGDGPETLAALAAQADFVYHLAGIQHSQDDAESQYCDYELTVELLNQIKRQWRRIPVLLTSTMRTGPDEMSDLLKQRVEEAVLAHGWRGGESVIYRLPYVFDNWGNPNYNSLVARYCHRIARDLPLEIGRPDAPVAFAHINDVVAELKKALNRKPNPRHGPFGSIRPIYQMTLRELAERIASFRNCGDPLRLAELEDDFTRFLYVVYLTV